ncbi:MAG TPA: hypothetical protein VHW26_14220 [Solirubrobacteraceae bacterium]|nr:hypothetical protein [Solirubrobacteraceae bacterium]
MSTGSDLQAGTRREVLAALTTMLDAGVAAGAVRADVWTHDVLAAIGAIWRTRTARRILMLITDGLRHRSTSRPVDD